MNSTTLSWTRDKFKGVQDATFYVSGRYRIEPITSPSKKSMRTGYGQSGEKGWVNTGWAYYRDGKRVCGCRTLAEAKARAERDEAKHRAELLQADAEKLASSSQVIAGLKANDAETVATTVTALEAIALELARDNVYGDQAALELLRELVRGPGA